MEMLIRIGNFCEKIILVIAVIFMSIIPLAMGIQVVFRNFNVAVNWSEEVARFSYVAVTFLGSILGVKYGRHITIDFLFVLLPPPLSSFTLCMVLLIDIIPCSIEMSSFSKAHSSPTLIPV